jgi:hypothetical protein
MNLQGPDVTACTVPAGSESKILQWNYSMYLCVLYGPQHKQWLSPYIAKTICFYNQGIVFTVQYELYI